MPLTRIGKGTVFVAINAIQALCFYKAYLTLKKCDEDSGENDFQTGMVAPTHCSLLLQNTENGVSRIVDS